MLLFSRKKITDLKLKFCKTKYLLVSTRIRAGTTQCNVKSLKLCLNELNEVSSTEIQESISYFWLETRLNLILTLSLNIPRNISTDLLISDYYTTEVHLRMLYLYPTIYQI